MMTAARRTWLSVLGAGVVGVLAGCAPLSPTGSAAHAVPVIWRPSPNFDERRPNFVILHQTGSNMAERALRTLTDPAKKVSAHYLVGRDGTIVQLVDERARAWHAGISSWGGQTDINSASIGIELDNDGDEPFPEAQIVALLPLLADLRSRYGIPVANFLGHGDIAPGRKVDPNRQFPWQRLAEKGFGLWCDAPPSPSHDVDGKLALQALGYNVSNEGAAVRAFRRHWAGRDDAIDALDIADKAMLACLLAQKGSPARSGED